MVSRNVQRKDFDDHQRIVLAEQDLDGLGSKLDTTNKLLIGILITMATGTTFAAAAVVTGAIG